MDYVLITGASSGIGYELALLFAKKRQNLILVARQEKKLLHISSDLKKNYSIEAHVIPHDLSHIDSAKEIFRTIKEKSFSVNYLVNNACFYVKGSFCETTWKDEQELIQMQCISHSQLTKLLLPLMIKQGKGGILNICSTGSFVPGPYNAVYCAAKSFVLSFSQALAEELSGTGVHVTALCPGGTDTAFQDLSKRRNSVMFPVMKASKVAEIGYRAFMKGKRVVVPGAMNKLQVFLMNFIPRRLVVRLAGLTVTN